MNRCLVFISLLAAATGAGAQVTPPRPTQPASQTVEQPATVEHTPIPGVGAPVDPNKYQIGAEDVLFIRVWREPDFTGPVGVRPDGKITLPLVGEVQAAGLTPTELQKKLTEDLSKYLVKPEVTVTVQDVRSQVYYIDGEVNHGGEFQLVTPTKILEALSKAGGFREFANTKKIRILRGSETLNFNYNDVIRGKHMEQNIYLKNGDHIIVR